MNRFYSDQKIEGDRISISDADQIHHLKDVLRLKAGDQVMVFDSGGNECTASIAGIGRTEATLQVESRRPPAKKRFRLTIGCAIPKKDRMDEIVDMLTQLGVDRIVPLETERVVVRLEERKKELRLVRWKSIALSASRQSQRNDLPQVDPVTSLPDLITAPSGFDLKLIPTLEGRRQSILEALSEKRVSDILALIGPEGDFSPSEVEMAVSSGFLPVSLGNSVLRVDTAAVAVASFICFFLQ
jgi:16S rRNA (uracil1498-N3)-methyltransferase